MKLEIMDYGYPQNCSLDAIRPFITQKGKTIKPEKVKEKFCSFINCHLFFLKKKA